MSNAQRLQWQFPKNVSNGLIGWRSDGLGLENKLAAFNDVKQFGAEGDGVTDDTAAITAALARLTSGGVLFFPAGTYLISSTIDTLSNVTFAGAGMGASIILADAADFNMIEVQDGQSDIAFRDLTIKGAATADSTTQYGVIASASSEASRVTIERCRFTNSNNGISTGSGTGWRVNECYFDTLVGVISGTGYGVLVAGSSTRCHVTGCDYLGTSGNGRHAVYLSVNATYCRVVGNSVKDCNETAIVCRASTGQGGVHGNIIAGNNIEGGGTVSSDASAAILVAGIATWNEVYGNFVEDFANDGIVVSNLSEAGTCQFNSVADNTVVECDLRGIDIRGTKSTRVSGNRVYNCSQASSGTHAGLRIVEDTATNEVC
ncbi:MAG: glycosyl hydrolase family 28-related protein, partial [Beijerinckiaceae bacterium]